MRSKTFLSLFIKGTGNMIGFSRAMQTLRLLSTIDNGCPKTRWNRVPEGKERERERERDVKRENGREEDAAGR
jgi:hypothetical protein